MMNKRKSVGMWYRVLGWYFRHVKYRHWTRNIANVLIAFEWENRSAKETESLLTVIRNTNLERVTALYSGDIERAKDLDELMGELGKQHDDEWNEHERLSAELWKQVITNFVERYKDNPKLIEDIWGIVLPRT